MNKLFEKYLVKKGFMKFEYEGSFLHPECNRYVLRTIRNILTIRVTKLYIQFLITDRQRLGLTICLRNYRNYNTRKAIKEFKDYTNKLIDII